MKLFRIDLLIILISLFIFNSCKNPDEIGLEVQPDEKGLNGEVTDTCSIVSYVVRDDSVVSSSLARNLIGEFRDPILGTTKASLAAHMLLSKNDVNFGSNITLDSMVLVLGYIESPIGDRFYGDTSSTFTINVYELKEDISGELDSIYYSNKDFNYDPSPIFSQVIKPHPKDSVLINQVRTGKPDTLVKTYPQIRLRLSDAFAQRILAKSGQPELKDNLSFLTFFKGFYITMTRVSGDGGIVSVDLTNTNRSSAVLYYRSGTERNNFVFNINSPAANISRFEHDYTGTPVANQLADTSLGRNIVYVQSMAGLRTKINFPNLKHLTDSGVIAINKAELIISIDGGSDAIYPAITTLGLDGVYFDNTQESLGSATLNTGSKQYTIDLSKKLQDILAGRLALKAMYLNDRSKQIKANRSILGGGENISYKMKLRIVYTKLY